ncbi:MAG: hypothetical protein Fur0024_4690 [Patescibacteria group bacterium]
MDQIKPIQKILLMNPSVIDDSVEFVQKVSENAKDVTKRNLKFENYLKEIANDLILS